MKKIIIKKTGPLVKKLGNQIFFFGLYLNEKICGWGDGDAVVIQLSRVIGIRIEFRQRLVLARENAVTNPDFLRLLRTSARRVEE